MPPPLSIPQRRLIFGGSAILALLLAGIAGWRLWNSRVRAHEVTAFLDESVGAGRVRFSDVRIGTTRLGDDDLQLTVASTARTVGPLYARIDPTDYLRGMLHLDPESTAEVRRLLAGKDALQRPEFLRLGPFPADPFQAEILRLIAQAGAPFAYQAMVAAHREGERWRFTLLSGAYEGPAPAGEARATFGASSFLADDARDDSRLRALEADLRAFAARVADTQRNLEAVHAVALNVRRDALMSWLAPGSVFRGAAQRPGEQQGTTLYLEITGLSAGNGVTALLRNSGGWHYARVFQGSWSADDEFGHPVLNLASLPDQAVRNGGPILENSQAWTLSLQMDPKGNLAETTRFLEYRFQFMNAAQVPAIEAALQAEFEWARSVTEPGSLFHGAAVSKASGVSEPVLLRFTERTAEADSFQADIESTARSWKRPFQGTLIGNSKRSGGQPVRLRTGSDEAVVDAPADSVLGERADLEIRLGMDNGALAGEDDHFKYRFATVGSGDLTRLDNARAALAARFKFLLRDGIDYDGIVRDTQGSNTQVRLEITHIDRQKGTVTATIHSLVQLNVYQNLRGAWNSSDVSVTLSTTGDGKFDFSGILAVPFLVAPVAHTIQLALVGSALTGGIKDDSQWSMEFPAGEFLAAPTEGTEPDSPPANGTVFPSFPKVSGAYVLAAGNWRPLPRNGGHVVVETSHPMNEDELSNGPLGLVSLGVRRFTEKGQKTSFLEFDGKDPRPECAGPALVLIFVGPDLLGTPPLELAPVGTVKDGRRRIEVLGGPPGTIRFGEQRVAAYVRRAGPGAVLLTTTSNLSPGPYAFNADAGYELTIRQ